MPEKHIVDAAVRAVRSLAGWREMRILDVSCGDGDVIDLLAKDGCRVEGTHFRDDDYIFKNPSPALQTEKIHKGIDLCRPLPLPDSSYDVVIATEVLEHLPSHITFFSEAGRILAEGGHLIVSTPNIQRLSSRVRFLLTGNHELRGARLDWSVPPEELYTTHYNTPYFPVLHTLLYHNDLYIDRLQRTRLRFWNHLLLILYPIVWMATVIEARHVLKRSRACGRDILRWMTSYQMLFSDQLLLIAQKRN